MKKFFTLAVLALSAFGLYAQGDDSVVDSFTYRNLAESPSNFTTYSGTYQGNAGSYNFTFYNGYMAAWFNNEFNTFISGSAEGRNITKVERVGGTKSAVMVYASNEALTYDNCTSAPFSAQLYYDSSVEITGDYKYVLLRMEAGTTATANFDSLDFTWTKAGGPVEPTIETNDISVPTLQEKCPTLNFTSGYGSPTINDPFDLSFDNGAVYHFNQMASNAGANWWMLCTDGYLTVKTPATNKWVESVEIIGDSFCHQTNISFGNVELNSTNFETDGEYQSGVDMPGNKVVLKPYVPAKYFYINKTSECYYNVKVNWSDQMPVYQVTSPILECWDDPKTNASNVQIRLPYVGAQIKLEVYVKEAGAADYTLDANLSKTYTERAITIPMPGKAGAMVKFVAVGVRENCKDSEPAEAIYGPLEMADATAPQLIVNGTYVADPWSASRVYLTPGGKFSVVVGERTYNQEDHTESVTPIEGATVKYQYTVKDANGETVSTGDEVTATTNPAEVTVPATVAPGNTFAITATSVIPDRKDKSMTFDLSVISDVLPAPTFSLPSGSDVVKGEKVQIIKPQFADSIFWTVNGGEVNGSDWSQIDVTIDKETIIEAWATAKNLKPSEHVTCTFKIEVLEAWMDAITPYTFVPAPAEEFYNMATNEYTAKSSNTNVDYKYYGEYASDWFAPQVDGKYKGLFKFSNSTYYLTNTTAYDKKGEELIKSIKIDGSQNSGKVYVAFANEAFEAPTADSDICKEDYAGNIARVSVGGSDSGKVDYVYGQWIELKGIKNVEGDGTKFFMIFPGDGNDMEASRVVVHYWDPKDGVSTIVTEDVDGAVYSISGYRVNSENLAPGIYVRKQNGKSVKFVVK